MGLLPKSKRHAEKFFQGGKNVADAVDKMASVAVAFGFGDPTGATLTVSAAVSVAAKSVSAISAALAELAKSERPSGDDGADRRTTLVLCVANLAYFRAVEEILTSRLPEIGHLAIMRSTASDLEAAVLRDEAHRLLQGRCSLFDIYEAQLKQILGSAGAVWSEREKMARQVTSRAESLFSEMLTRSEEPFAALRVWLQNDAIAQMPAKVVDEFQARMNVGTSRDRGLAEASNALPVPPIGNDELRPREESASRIDDRLARIENLLRSTPRVEASGASEVSAQLRANKSAFDAAKGLLEKGQLSAASALFETVAKELEALTTEEATNLRARAIANRGHCLHRQGSDKKAAEFFREAYRLAPTNLRLRVNVAVADLIEGNLDAAEAQLRRLAEEKPDEVDVVELLAEVLAQKGSVGEAVVLLEGSPRDTEHYLCTLSNLLLKLGRNDEAEKKAREALKRNPTSHESEFCVALAIAGPILDGSDDGSATTAAERTRLAEAAGHLERAIATARKEEQQGRLVLYLGNLCGVAAAVGDHEKGVRAGEEARALGEVDVILLKNLFAAQITSDRYLDAAATARDLAKLVPAADSTLREMHALIGANQYDKALEAYARTAPGNEELADDPHLIALRAECLRMLPDYAAAELLLTDSISRLGRLPPLLVQQAHLWASKRDYEAADVIYQEAERLATGREYRVVRRRYGLFLHQRRRWADAVSRLVEPEEDVASSALVVEYLHCLLELKRMPEVAGIGSKCIARGIFRAPVWEITAEALLQLGRLRDAEKLMAELVQHVPSERQYLAFAGVCFRNHGARRAIKVLEAAQIRHRKSFYVHANLSGLYFSVREYKKAFDAAKVAVEIAPNREEGHTAMVRILAAGNAVTLSNDEKKLLHESIARSKSIRQIHMAVEGDDIDLSPILAMLKEQSEHVTRIMGIYRAKRFPLSVISRVLGREFIDVWLSITSSDSERHYVASGTYEEQTAEHTLANEANAVVLDYSALLTLQALGMLELLPRAFGRVMVATPTYEKILAEHAQLAAFAPSTATIAYDAGKIRYTETPETFHQRKVGILDAIVSFIESPSVAIEGMDEISWRDWQERREPEILDGWIYQSILIAKAKGCALYCDEQGMRSIATLNHGVKGFSTQALLRALCDKGILSSEELQRGVLKLVGLNYDFISLGGHDVVRHLKDEKYQRTWLFAKILRQLEACNYTDEKSSWILGATIGHLWFETSGDAVGRSEWINACIGSLSAAKNRELTLIDILGASGTPLAYFPEAYTALLHHLQSSPSLTPQERKLVKVSMIHFVELLARAFTEAIPHDARVRGAWHRLTAWLKKRTKLLK